MTTNDTIIKVKNRDSGPVGYSIPDLSLVRNFQPGEVKELTYEELFKLYQVPGGDYIINNYLIVYDEEALGDIINGTVEPEYYYTEAEIIDLMKNGTLDEFEDCLNFAPEGVLDLIKEIAIQLPLNDVAKRDLILKKLSFDVAGAIELAKIDGEELKDDRPKRKAQPRTVKPEAPVRKVVKKTVAPEN